MTSSAALLVTRPDSYSPHASTSTTHTGLPAALEQARHDALAQGLPFAGSIDPDIAWSLHQDGAAVIIDVRSAEERKFVGHVPSTLHVPWASGTALTRNPRFVREVESKAGKTHALLLLCRSGKRSAAAAEVLTKAGFLYVFNVLEGFEGDLDERQQRGRLGGWRWRSLPWVQD